MADYLSSYLWIIIPCFLMGLSLLVLSVWGEKQKGSRAVLITVGLLVLILPALVMAKTEGAF
jgi:hypothetical protein